MCERHPHSYENHRDREFASRHYHLLGKVVLIVGNDTDVLQTLVIQLAKRGADIALFYRQMPKEAVCKIKEGLKSVGRNFLLVEEAEYQLFPAGRLVQTVKNRMGRIDIFIDLSAQSNGSLPNYQLTKEALKEINRSHNC